MRYLLSKTLRSRFTRAMRRAMPEFGERKAWSGVRGTYVYEWRASAEVSCYVALVIDETSDRFTVEVAWSRSHRFPAQIRQDSPADAAQGGPARFHLRALWQRYRIEPSWWLVERAPADQELEHTLIDPGVSGDEKLARLEARQRQIEGVGTDVERQSQLVVDQPMTEALARVAPAIEDVMARLGRYARPYFAGVVAAESGRRDGLGDARSPSAGPV